MSLSQHASAKDFVSRNQHFPKDIPLCLSSHLQSEIHSLQTHSDLRCPRETMLSARRPGPVCSRWWRPGRVFWGISIAAGSGYGQHCLNSSRGKGCKPGCQCLSLNPAARQLEWSRGLHLQQREMTCEMTQLLGVHCPAFRVSQTGRLELDDL